MEQDNDTIILSPSAINVYTQCPRKFYYRYNKIPHLPLTWQAAADFGTKIHKIIETYYRHIPKAMTPKEVKLYLSRAVKSVTGEIDDKLMRHLNGFVRFEQERLTWHISTRPFAIEKEFTKPPFHGYIDAIFKKGDKLVIVDWKTGYGWNPTLNDNMIIQGMIYKYITGIDEMYFVFLQSGKYLELNMYNEKIQKMNITITNIIEKINNREFNYNIGEHCKKCEYQITCWLERNNIKWSDVL